MTIGSLGSLSSCTKRLSLHPVLTFLSRPPESVRSSEVRIGDCTLHMRQEKYFRIVLRRATAPRKFVRPHSAIERAAGVKEGSSVWRFQCDLVVCSNEGRESAFRELGSGFGFAACAACGAFMVTINMDASVRPPKFQRKSCFRVFVGLPFPNDSIPKQSPVHHLG